MNTQHYTLILTLALEQRRQSWKDKTEVRNLDFDLVKSLTELLEQTYGE